MSIQLVKLGEDIAKINGDLVSVKKDYPFWKVNLNTSEQYWSALIPDLRTKMPLLNFSTPENAGVVNSSNMSLILAPNGSLYSCPDASPSIVKITPNPDNYLNPIIETIGSFGTVGSKWVSVHLVGDYLVYVPGTANFILVLDTRNDSIQQFGSFIGTQKWGAGDLTDDGRIFCPPNGSTDWLIIDVTNPTNITTSLHAGLVGQGTRGGCVNGGNGFMYTFFHSNANFSMTKINVDTLIETIIPNTTGTSFRTGKYGVKGFNFNGVILFTRFGTNLMTINTNQNDAVSDLGLVVASAVFNTPCMGADGWLYYTHTGANYINFRVNPLNYTVEITTTTFSSNGGGTMVLANDGRLYGISLGSQVLVRGNAVTEPMQANRLLSRYTNSK